MCCCRLRLSANPGRSDEVRVVVEVLPVVANLSMVQVIKSRGTSVEFYKFYADLAQQLQGLISQNALSLPPAAVAHQAALDDWSAERTSAAWQCREGHSGYAAGT